MAIDWDWAKFIVPCPSILSDSLGDFDDLCFFVFEGGGESGVAVLYSLVSIQEDGMKLEKVSRSLRAGRYGLCVQVFVQEVATLQTGVREVSMSPRVERSIRSTPRILAGVRH